MKTLSENIENKEINDKNWLKTKSFYLIKSFVKV